MNMVASGGIFLLLVGLSGGAGMPSDLLSLIDPESYFRSRQVPVTVEKMLELAGKQPTDAKGRVARLLALRMLGEDPAEVKNEKAAIVKALEPIANGKEGDDAHGFARAYARQTLRRLGVKADSGEPDAAHPKLIDGFTWFPEKVTFVAGGVQPRDKTGDRKPNALRDFLKKNMPAQAVEEMYKFAEAVGNVRIDRIAFGFAPDPKQQHQARIFVRITGAADHKALAAYLRKNLPSEATVKDDKGPGGELLALINMGKFAPAMALVGDTDFLLAAHEGPRGPGGEQANHLEVIDQILKVRAGGQANALKGPLADELKKIAPEAAGLLLGEVPLEVRQTLLLAGPVQAVPERIRAEVKRGSKGSLDISFSGTFGNANEAKSFADNMSMLTKQAIEALKKPPPAGADIPPKAFTLMRSTLEGLKMEPKGSAVTGGVHVSGELLELVPVMMGRWVQPSPPMPPRAIPVPAKEKQSRLRFPAGSGAGLAPVPAAGS
jgi:hypothetical protein